MQRRPFLGSGERIEGSQARRKRREGFSSASAVRGEVRQGVGWTDEAVGVKVKWLGKYLHFFLFFFLKRNDSYSPDSCWTPGWSCVLNNWL